MLKKESICISRPRLFAWPWPPALAPNLCSPALTSSLCLLALAPNCVYQPWPPICVYRPWSPIRIYRPWPTILLPVRDLSLHIPTLSPQFVFAFTALAYDLYYRSGAWFAFTLLLAVVAVVVVIVVVVFIYLFIYLLIYLFVYLFIYIFIYLFVCFSHVNLQMQ